MKNIAIFSIFISFSILVPINPLVIYYMTGSRSTAIYAGMIDLCVIVILLFSFGYIRRGSKRLSYLLTASLIATIPALFVGEIMYVYARQAIGDQALGIDKSQYLRPNPMSLYSPVPNAVGTHKSPGNFKVKYYIDEKGRKKIEQSPSASKTLHFFGDSFTFGSGVTNDDSALNLLAKQINERVNIQNYGVGGYGIELMYLRFTEFIDEIKPGDVVVFSPVSIDLRRGWPGRSTPCKMVLSKGSPATFPRIVRGEVEYVSVKHECNLILDALLSNTTFTLSIGRLYKSLRTRMDHQEIIDAADDIFSHAERLATSRGATFQLVFLPMPRECEHQEYALDLEGLKTSYFSLLQYCPSDQPSLEALRFPSDSHWSPFGNQWAAGALYKVFEKLEAVNVSGGASN